MSDGIALAAPPCITLQDAAEFIWREADLLDRHDYYPWLALWTEGGRYVIPIERDAADYAAVLNVVYDDAGMRAARVKRLISGFSMSSAPAARTIRTVSRFVVTDSGTDTVTVRAAQNLTEYKYGRTRVMAADVTYRLVRQGDGLKLDQKVVQLINSDDAQHGIGYLL
ncbi:aromatic-ring-hydroxylating dioxygenase subunit beta [Azospirillum sp. B4]|uniref:aromatic-ring-hydroxylating dioxygenase subunit beta n=1 Tax=Azospirillum sp. B4 TaxID=95605 RepID=UPI00034BC97D|nr:aromatic-ring-hydroxylating dioxygenase subunit beta [Azospirillum sp. B4]